MRITAITVQARDKSRVNISVDGQYRFSLNMAQLADLGIRTGKEYDEATLRSFEEESQFGKLYMQALAYCFSRPHSQHEIEQYLHRKTQPHRSKSGELKAGVSPLLAERVMQQLIEAGHVNDEAFAQYWVENRRLRQGASKRKLMSELRAKAVPSEIIDKAVRETDRDEIDELRKVIKKRSKHYDDPQKLVAYLGRQGFSYDDIKTALESPPD